MLNIFWWIVMVISLIQDSFVFNPDSEMVGPLGPELFLRLHLARFVRATEAAGRFLNPAVRWLHQVVMQVNSLKLDAASMTLFELTTISIPFVP